VGHFL